MHGLDPRQVPQMKASFFAAGPDILPGKTVAPFENVNLYPWLAHLLGLTPPKSDGDLNVLAGTLRGGVADSELSTPSAGNSSVQNQEAGKK
jgi:alkaline phosphatase D